MNIPADLKYTKTHEWAQFTGEGKAKVGITDFAQDSLGSLVFVNLPEPGDEVACGESFGDVESVKAVSELVCPFSGTVEAINEELLDAPEKINEEPYDAWLIEVSDIGDSEELMNAEEYADFCDEENA
ncbi:MAG: glycine cleavage system protein GcvH [Oscillospiraceae bacterium]|jgi:glycine cleavage system H protein|nr:glycine cleavage system protein GcvH [Oscillospiraceae bacterium]